MPCVPMFNVETSNSVAPAAPAHVRTAAVRSGTSLVERISSNSLLGVNDGFCVWPAIYWLHPSRTLRQIKHDPETCAFASQRRTAGQIRLRSRWHARYEERRNALASLRQIIVNRSTDRRPAGNLFTAGLAEADA